MACVVVHHQIGASHRHHHANNQIAPFLCPFVEEFGGTGWLSAIIDDVVFVVWTTVGWGSRRDRRPFFQKILTIFFKISAFFKF